MPAMKLNVSAGHQQPAAPDHQPGAEQVGARRAAGEPQPGDQQDQRRGQQPARPGRRSRSRTSAACPVAPSGRPGPRDRRRPSRSRRRSAGRSRCSRGSARGSSCAASRRCTAATTPATARRSRPTSRRPAASSRTRRAGARRAGRGWCARRAGRPARAPGSTRNACSILVRNARPTRAPASASQRTGCPVSPCARSRDDSSARTVRRDRADQQQHQQGVGVVEAEHQHRDGGECEDRCRRAGPRPPTASYDGPCRTAGPPTPRPSAPAAPAGSTTTGRRTAPTRPIDPQRSGGLVDGDRAGRVGGAEEERLPGLRAGLRGGGVERVGPP